MPVVACQILPPPAEASENMSAEIEGRETEMKRLFARNFTHLLCAVACGGAGLFLSGSVAAQVAPAILMRYPDPRGFALSRNLTPFRPHATTVGGPLWVATFRRMLNWLAMLVRLCGVTCQPHERACFRAGN